MPDLAGWRADRHPELPDDNPLRILPDWCAEVLSPSTASDDRTLKLPLHTSTGVGHVWLIDPLLRTLEVYESVDGRPMLVATARDRDVARLPPFDADLSLGRMVEGAAGDDGGQPTRIALKSAARRRTSPPAENTMKNALILQSRVLMLAGALSLTVLGTSASALAQEEVIVDIQPPAPRVEVIPVAPSPRHFWVHGYYTWIRGAHVWVPGHYDVIRPGWHWAEARWGLVGHHWHFYPGHWWR